MALPLLSTVFFKLILFPIDNHKCQSKWKLLAQFMAWMKILMNFIFMILLQSWQRSAFHLPTRCRTGNQRMGWGSDENVCRWKKKINNTTTFSIRRQRSWQCNSRRLVPCISLNYSQRYTKTRQLKIITVPICKRPVRNNSTFYEYLFLMRPNRGGAKHKTAKKVENRTRVKNSTNEKSTSQHCLVKVHIVFYKIFWNLFSASLLSN